MHGNSETYKNIFLYQSMSGDADEGTALFTAKDSAITTNKGDTIFVTNTKATIALTNSSSSITLTGNTYITSFENADSTNSNINFNGYKLYVNGTAIN